MISNIDYDKKIKITLFVIGSIFLIAFVIYSVYCYYVISTGIKFNATIININENSTTVSFLYNGQEIITKFNYTNDMKSIGDSLIIYYLQNSNKSYILFSLWFPNLICLSIGLPFFVVGLSFFLNEAKIKKFNLQKNNLIKKIAKVKAVEINKTVALNNKNPSRLICEVYYEGEKLILKSKNIWDYIYFENCFVVDIYFKNKKKYFIDLESYRKDELYYEMEEY